MHSPVDGLSTPEPRHQPDALAEEDQWLDEVLSQTFPASDPVPRRHKDAASNTEDEPA